MPIMARPELVPRSGEYIRRCDVPALNEWSIITTAVGRPAPDAEPADFTATSPGAWLVALVPWTEAEHRIAAISADAASAQALEITSTASCLLVERRNWRGPDTVTIVHQVFRGDAFDLIDRFGPRSGIG